MAEASGVALKFEFNKIPFISGARKYAEMGCFAGGAFDNKTHFEPKVGFSGSIDEQAQMLLFDPQTSGGLLMGVPQEKLDSLRTKADKLGQKIWVIGKVQQGSGIQVGG
jgi:selenide,water dikinase